MSDLAYRRTRFLSRKSWIFWACILPFVIITANLWLGRGDARSMYYQGFWAIADGLLTGLAAIFFLRDTLLHRVVFAFFYAGSYVIVLMFFTWALLAWLSPASSWPTPNLP